MPTIRAEYIYPVHQLVVRRSLLGTSVLVSRDGAQVEVCIPLDESDGVPKPTAPGFEFFSENLDLPLPPEAGELTVTALANPSSSIVDVNWILVRVSWQEESDSQVAAREGLEKGSQVAGRVMESLLALVRAEGSQPWLGMSGESPEAASMRLLNLDDGVRLPNPARAGGTFRVVDRQSVLTPESLDVFVARAVDGEKPTLAEALLADALYFQWEHFPQAAALSILLAAVACEVKVKDVLRATAGSKLGLVEVLLTNPRDYTMQAQSLFTKAMEAVNGRNLKTEDPELAKAVGSLFEIRNRIAHKGGSASVTDARTCGITATKTFEWLRSISIEGSARPAATPA